MKAWMRQPSTAYGRVDQDQGDLQKEQHIDHGHGSWSNALYLLTDRGDLLTKDHKKSGLPITFNCTHYSDLWRQVLTPHQEHA